VQHLFIYYSRLMAHLALVKPLSRLQEEQQYSDELLLASFGLSFIRGSLAELAGEPSTGKIGLSLSLLSKLTQAGEICAAVDSANAFDPISAALAGIRLENLLWVRCGGDMEKAFIAADHLVQAKGFGAVWLNLCGLAPGRLRLVPKTYWYRYRTRIRETPTLFIVTAPGHAAGSAARQSFLFSRRSTLWSGSGRFKLLRRFFIDIHSRKQFYGRPIPARLDADYSNV
jgi:hypothetical protein